MGTKDKLSDLIEALQILLKYDNPSYPTYCGHETLFVKVDPTIVSKEDRERLDILGFHCALEGEEEYDNYVSEGYDEGFISYRFGD